MSKTTIPRGGITADAIDGTLIADDAINSEHYTDGSIDTAHIGDNQVTAAKATGVGNLVKITSGSASSGDTAITIAGCFTSTYKIYKLFLYDWNTSNDQEVYLRWLTGTNTEQSGSSSYQYAGVGRNTDSQGSDWNGLTDYGKITGETVRHDSDEHFAWEGVLFNPAGTTLKKRLVFGGGGRRTGNYGFNGHGTLEWNSTTAITGVKFYPQGNTIDSASYAIYGVVT